MPSWISCKRTFWSARETPGFAGQDIPIELGRRKTVGGQEDMIEDLALDMAREAGTI